MSSKTLLALYGVAIVIAVGMALGAILAQWVPAGYVCAAAAVVTAGSLVSAAFVPQEGGRRER